MRAFLGVCLALAAAAGYADEGASTAALAITHVTVIDATGAAPQADMTVIVKDQRIAELGKSDEVRAPVRCHREWPRQVPDPRPLGHARSRGVQTIPVPHN